MIQKQVPISSTQVSPRALNKLAFDRSSPISKKIATAGADGKVYIYDISEKIVTPRENEWVEMQKTVNGLIGIRDSGGGLGSVDIGVGGGGGREGKWGR